MAGGTEDEEFDDFLERVLDEAGLSKSAIELKMDKAVDEVDLFDNYDAKQLGSPTGSEHGVSRLGSKDSSQHSASTDRDDFLAWLANEDADFEYEEDSDNGDGDQTIKRQTSDNENDSELLTNLSAELQLGLNETSRSSILNICKKMGKIHKSFRIQVWMCLLGIEADKNGIQVLRNRPRTYSSDHDDEDEEIINAMTETAVLRNAALKSETEEHDRSWVLEENGSTVSQVRTHTRETVRAFSVPASMLDPGLVDVIYVLSSSLLGVPGDQIPLVVAELQRKRILLLQFPEEDSIVKMIVARRAKLLDLAMELHDKEIGEYLSRIAESRVLIPWRWWRCAFAGDLAVSSLLVLWDRLLIDACPENSGDEGPSIASPKTGIGEGCDPRGPLVVYIIIALLIRSKVTILGDESSDPSQASRVLEVLRSGVAALSAHDVVVVCEEARILRASTPLPVIDQAFKEEEKKVPVESIVETSSIAANGDKTSQQKKTMFGGWFSRPKQQEKVQTGHAAKKTSFADRFKLTLGLGDSSADALKRTDAENKARIRHMLKDYFTIVDLEEDGVDQVTDSEEERRGIEESESDEDEFIAATDEDETAQISDVSSNAAPTFEKRTTTESVAHAIATSKYELSGLQQDMHFKLSLLEQVPVAEWNMLPIYFGSGQIGLMLMIYFRIITLKGDGIRRVLAIQPKENGKYTKAELLKNLSNVGGTLTVLCTKHLSQLSQILLYRAEEEGRQRSKRKIKLSFRGEEIEERFRLNTRHVQSLVGLIESQAEMLFCG
uniref:Rab-GAP TBC domain-containing protein n=1 Tax=Mucochytrium quahogii TaxID=96639 RepID=A0A7S2WP49_9STRA|mmetsp:Transcript_31627/g.50494  ORF Transcript_31627/g.50494 Transcript_31627/m.50494 type:complete len:779 (-) Transcript_31627:862-3198(-)|eukprot:CAMPEP_0203756122 /NCGR_PEP_ID=MMETSP0098-20131031/9442_1 /ASSEMBLY_ACC=CAM_ASM_000208 /TAXON_ID=96639 /ORGANISM=" , Strain NY0313808BC1" /LENGTH=778 /DNA_ID=CAMNT_0050647867 /DNA_START=94 /DNA_END=2430 /DNA_ORIENTATION=+